MGEQGVQTDVQKLKARIWITRQNHIQAEKRNRFLEHYFHIVLALYALSSIAVSLYPITDSSSNVQKFLLPFSSIFTLSISLLIFGFKFGETAAKHRTCYLELQKLELADFSDVSKVNEKYTDILGNHSNHTNADHMKTVITNIFSDVQETRNSFDQNYVFTWFQRFKFGILVIVWWLLMIIFFIGPFILFWFGAGLTF
jgi:hypothetical protein